GSLNRLAIPPKHPRRTRWSGAALVGTTSGAIGQSHARTPESASPQANSVWRPDGSPTAVWRARPSSVASWGNIAANWRVERNGRSVGPTVAAFASQTSHGSASVTIHQSSIRRLRRPNDKLSSGGAEEPLNLERRHAPPSAVAPGSAG